jgi:hypothetical protein
VLLVRKRRRAGGREEGAEAELEEGREAGVAGVDDLADVLDELCHGHRGAAAPDDAVHPRNRGLAGQRGSLGEVHCRLRGVLERGELELAGQRGQLRAPRGGCDVGQVAGDVAARRREVHVGRRALADHGRGRVLLLLLLVVEQEVVVLGGGGERRR